MTAPLSPEERERLLAALPDSFPIETAAPTPHPQLALTKLFMAAGPRARREFLADAKASDPALFAEIAKEAQ
jgi:hypothetical protein